MSRADIPIEKNSKFILPRELEVVRRAALRAVGEVRPSGPATLADPKFLFTAQRTKASSELPAYYLVYFLLVDLLGFRNLGQFEKISWSVPIDFKGKAFLIEHRKMGLGVFAHDATAEEGAASQIVMGIRKGVKVAQPFFDWFAGQAALNSAVNVLNKSEPLFSRFIYFLNAYRAEADEPIERKCDRYLEKCRLEVGSTTTRHIPSWQPNIESSWLALAAVDAFFSWTEHVFIHIAILTRNIKTGVEVAQLAAADWPVKFKRALDVSEPNTKKLFDELVMIRRQLRNFVAHGAFGKQGEAFTFHSGAGAVPVLLPHSTRSRRFTLGRGFSFDDASAFVVIEEFISHLWSGQRQAAKIYLQQSELPLILTLVADGTYAKAMTSSENMTKLVEHLMEEFEKSVNMDW
jgi:hypothetical protein